MNQTRTDQPAPAARPARDAPKHIGRVPVPSSFPALAAWDVCAEHSPEFLVNHCARSYAWAWSYGSRSGVAFDEEHLWIAAMLHDMALTAPFDSHAVPFEEASGQLTRVFGRAAGLTSALRDAIADTVVLHMRDDVGPETRPEAHLLQFAVGLDVGGRGRDRLDAAFVAHVVELLPRHGFNAGFAALMADQGRRKPNSAAGQLVAAGLERRIAGNGFGG